jgi:hypothetical protein
LLPVAVQELVELQEKDLVVEVVLVDYYKVMLA